MAGTFRPGDILLVSPDSVQTLHPGDVVIFYPMRYGAANDAIVHRVVACTSSGLITQGDACSTTDIGYVQAWNLVGRVTRVQRDDKSYGVWGGFAGRLWVCYVRLRRRFLASSRLPYRWLRASGIVRRLWNPSIAYVTLMTEQGPVVKYLCRGKTVAIWRPETCTYWCRKPYDLVISRDQHYLNQA
ncbi:MAG: hypothetical protein JXA21_16860 [Anaerolineae bacterium]|nr:hypothetical protein [Anaerolineae bacterium]